MASDTKIFGVIALKGGVGKTTVVSNLGAALAREFNKKVLLIDANFTTPHLGLHLGMVNNAYNLQSVINNKYPIFEAIYSHPLGFHVIPGSMAPMNSNPLALKEKIEQLKGIYDVIIIDSSPSLNDEMFATMAASDELLVVSSPDYPTLSSTLYAIKVAKKKNTPIKGIVINKVRNKRFELTPKDIAKASEVDVLAVLPDNVGVLAALAEMTPVVAKSPRHDVSKEYKRLAATLIGEKYSSNIFSKIKNKISKKIKKEVK